jgi:hypothetical protein
MKPKIAVVIRPPNSREAKKRAKRMMLDALHGSRYTEERDREFEQPLLSDAPRGRKS